MLHFLSLHRTAGAHNLTPYLRPKLARLNKNSERKSEREKCTKKTTEILAYQSPLSLFLSVYRDA